MSLPLRNPPASEQLKLMMNIEEILENQNHVDFDISFHQELFGWIHYLLP